MKRIIFYFICHAVFCLSSSVFAEDMIDIAAIYALTGEAAEENAFSLYGVRCGVDEINEKGGILGKRLNLIVFDNQSTPIGSYMAAKQAVEANVTAIIGAEWSSHSLAIAKEAQAAGIPMISNISTHPNVTKIGDYIFRVCYTDEFQGSVMAKFARQNLKAADAVIFVNVTSDYSIGFSEVFRRNFEQLGGKVLLELEYKFKQQGFDKQISQAKKADADVVFLSGHSESIPIANMLKEAGVSSIPIGGDGWPSPDFLLKSGATLKRGYYCSHWSEFIASEKSRMFVEKYKHSNLFGVGTALAVDAVNVLADAIRRAGSTERKKIRDAIANTRYFEGITGTITFNADGDPVKEAVIMEIRDGKSYYLQTMKP